MSSITGLEVSTEVPKSPGSALLTIDAELLPQRLVEAQLLAHARDHVLGRAVADDGQHRIDRDHAADEEGDGEKAETGDAR